MRIITDTAHFSPERGTAVAIGKFDGIHVGHRRLLEEILKKKEEGLLSCVFTFDPAPAVLFGGSDGKELTTKEEKRVILEKMGIDILIEFPLTYESAAMPPEVFAREVLAKQLHARFIAAGTDLSFGAKGAGNGALLQRLGPELHFTIKIIDKVCVDGTQVSSTLVREYVESGDMVSAERLLGSPYVVSGEVVRGKKIGRTMGFPTVNLIPTDSKLLPPNGVYYSKVCHGSRMYRAISNVGYKPTVTDERVMGVESYLYDFEGEIYGEAIEVYLSGFKRPERQFDCIGDLKHQLEEDIEAGRVYPSNG